MEISYLIAKIIGPIYLITGLSMLINPNMYKNFLEKFMRDNGLLFISGFLSLLIGLLILTFHNIWVYSWQIIITIFGVIAIVKGSLILILPSYLIKITSLIHKNSVIIACASLAAICVGGLFTYYGYYS